MNKLFAAGVAAAVLSLSSVQVSAQQAEPAMKVAVPPVDPVYGDRATDMALDLILVRPIGAVGTVLGLAGFIVSLPLTLTTASADSAAREMVGRPFEYTFNRPLGDFNNCGADRHPCRRQ